MTDLPRRSILIGAALTPLAGCAGCAKPADTRVPAAPPAGQVLAQTSDIPVGGGAIVDGTLITQPSAGVFKGFAARCTHAGCALAKVQAGAAVCPCHGSSFGLDGEVLRGPATEPLTTRPVTVRGNDIVAG